jgi:hypothetical protein
MNRKSRLAYPVQKENTLDRLTDTQHRARSQQARQSSLHPNQRSTEIANCKPPIY